LLPQTGPAAIIGSPLANAANCRLYNEGTQRYALLLFTFSNQRTASNHMAAMPDSHVDIFSKKAFANIATVGADGTPQVTPVWVDFDGEFVLVNSAQGRKKDRNLRERPVVALSILDPDNPYRYIGMQGKVVEITTEGAEAHINTLSHKYFGRDYPYRAGEVRVIYKIKPEQVHVMG
jgi:PPOX class probable F420-dependent enzyme